MATSLVYRSSAGYELAMIALYQRHYFARYRALADLIPCRAQVLELCCGPGILYRRYLRQKNVQYHGVDINERFIRDLVDRGISAETWDLRSARPLPPAEYVIMQASLYHFLPDASWMLDRMLEAAHKTVIVAEPIRNLTCSRLKFVARLSHRLTDPGNGSQAKRFGESELDELMVLHGELLRRKFLVPGGREKVYVFEKGIGKQ